MAVTKKLNRVKFVQQGEENFYEILKHNVYQYFNEAKISKKYNRKMVIKTIAMLSMYFIPLVVILSGFGFINVLFFYTLWLIMGLGIVGIGCSVMHDSSHGAYSENKVLNKILGNILNLVGGYAPNWRIQHNILHHTYTNVDGLDEDIEAGKLLRMSPQQPLRKFHKYQHIYAWGLYCLMNLFWITAKDYLRLIKYNNNGMLKNQHLKLSTAIIELTLFKILYFTITLVLPIMLSGAPWYHVVGGFVIMHIVAGFSLAVIFQPAHVVISSEYPVPNANNKIEHNWAIHQLLNTADFAQDNKLVSWFIGGLNFQIEHHLFPDVCHVHYPAISKIVKKTAEENGVPYIVMPTFRSAILEHGRMLKRLGRAVN